MKVIFELLRMSVFSTVLVSAGCMTTSKVSTNLNHGEGGGTAVSTVHGEGGGAAVLTVNPYASFAYDGRNWTVGYLGQYWDGTYALVEKIGTEWRTVEISSRPIRRTRPGQEQLRFFKNEVSVVFDEEIVSTFEVDQPQRSIYYCSNSAGRRELKAYYAPSDIITPCTSAFTDKYGDESKINAEVVLRAVTQAKTIDAILGDHNNKEMSVKAYQVLKDYSNNNIQPKYNLKDNTGFYSNLSPVLKYNKTVNSDDKKYNRETTKFKVDPSFDDTISYDNQIIKYCTESTITPETFNLYYSDKIQRPLFSVNINKGKIRHVNIDRRFDDSTLHAELLIKNSGPAKVKIQNKSAKYVDIDTISIYVNDTILSQPLTKTFPPMSQSSFDIDLNQLYKLKTKKTRLSSVNCGILA